MEIPTGKTYFIADLHFGHANCLAFDNRPFMTIEEHDETLIKNWNNTVTDNDTVWILGDISWHGAEKTIEIFKQLKGHKNLCIGNHDSKLMKCTQLRVLFEEIVNYKELYLDNKNGIVLCHYPIVCYNKHFYGWYHLYGHVHTSFEYNMVQHFQEEMKNLYSKDSKMFNVGCMINYMNYTPRTLEEITGELSNEVGN